MGKNTRGQKEKSKEQELKFENAQLRRQVSSLRRQLARVDLDRYSHIRDMVEEHLLLDEEQKDSSKILEDLKASWTCYDCSQGHLEIIIYSKAGQTWYYRKCTNCAKRTKAKVYSEKVKGIRNPGLTGQAK